MWFRWVDAANVTAERSSVGAQRRCCGSRRGNDTVEALSDRIEFRGWTSMMRRAD